jgi:signal transduction histidine kinase
MTVDDLRSNETLRLQALRRYRVLETPAESDLDDLTILAARLCQTPVAWIALLDHQGLRLKTAVGWEKTVIPATGSFCEWAIAHDSELLVVSDATTDPRFHQHPLVCATPAMRFYAGTCLRTPEGVAIGTLAVLSPDPKCLPQEDLDTLQVLGRQIITYLEHKASVSRLERMMARRKRIEHVLYERHRQFQKMVDELQQTQTQLVQTEKMSSLGQMVAGVAHEINNPVSFVYGNLTYVKRYVEDLFSLMELYQRHYPHPHPEIQHQIDAVDFSFLSEDLPRILNSMKVGADRIRQIVLSLRNFSRLDESEKKPVNLHEGIDSTLLILQHRLKPSAQRSGIDVVRHYGDIPLVECYAGQLNQVFMNILSNAIDALEHALQMDETTNSPCITIQTEPVYTSENPSIPQSVAVQIHDNGTGISEEARSHIFDPFFTTKPVGKGTGLGLSISYQIVVERHGGILKCLSVPNQGTTFYIEIPVQSG